MQKFFINICFFSPVMTMQGYLCRRCVKTNAWKRIVLAHEKLNKNLNKN